MSAVSDLLNHIDGRDVPPCGGGRLENIAPATATSAGSIPRSGAEDVDAAVSAARRAITGEWGGWSSARRAALLDDVADRIEERLDELAALESRDTGKPISVARSVDIPRAVANFRFFAGAVRHDETGAHRMASAINYTLRTPVGVAALITPWNLPLYLLTWKTAPALAMGNTVVAKPSEMTPGTASALASIITEAGAPAGVFNVVHGLGPEAGQALTAHADVDLVSFTGGTSTGARVAATAAPSFKKLSLELGGKNPTIVFADADFDKTVAGAARAGFLNQGQICLCGSRVLVEESIYECFRDAFVERVSAMRVGDPSDPATELGALISEDHRRKVESYVALGIEEGGTVLTGGRRPRLAPPHDAGAFYEPTVIDGLPSTARAATEEIFGPVVTLHPFRDEAHAIAMANEVRYGLAASVWTRDLARAHRVSAAIETGMVWVNTWLLRDLRVPFGGVKDSGVGREGGKHSLEFFSEARNVCVALQ